MADPFDAALADLQRFIAIDIDDDGQPDAYTTADVIRGQDVSKSTARRVADTMGDMRMPYGPMERGGSGGYAVPAAANFVIGTVGAVADSIDNFQGGVRKGDPVKAGAAVAQGALTALPLTRYGAPLVSSIPRTLATMGGQVTSTDVARNGIGGAQAAGLSPDQQKQKAALEARVSRGQWNSGAERRNIEGQLADLRRIETDASTQENAARIRQQEADAAAKRELEGNMLGDARRARQDVLDKAPKPFHEEYPNWSRVQPFVPAAVGFASNIPGALIGAVGARRAASRWRGAVDDGLTTQSPAALMDSAKISAGYKAQFDDVPGLAKTLGPAAGIGGFEGAVTANVPEAYNALALPSVNPEVSAYQEYIKRLPQDHPEAIRAREEMEALNEAHPYQSAAAAHFRSPQSVGTKMGIGAMEGAGGAVAATVLGKKLGPSREGLPYAGALALENRFSPTYASDLSRARTPNMLGDDVTERGSQRLLAELDAIPLPPTLPAPLPPNRQLPPPNTPDTSGGAGAIPPPGPPPGGSGGSVPVPQQGSSQSGGQDGSSAILYGNRHKKVLRPSIIDEVEAGRNVPTMEQANMLFAGAKPNLAQPSAASLEPRLEAMQGAVAEMRAKGIPDDVIASIVQKLMTAKGQTTYPAIGLAAGMGGSQNMLSDQR